MGNANCDTRLVPTRKRAPRGTKEAAQRIASAEPVSSAVLLLQDVAPRKARGSHRTGPQMILTKKISGETIATLQPAVSVPSILRLKPPSVNCLQPGDSTPVSMVAVQQVGHMVNFSTSWRTGRFQVWSCSAWISKHIVWWTCAHARHRAAIILILPCRGSRKLNRGPRFVFCRL